MTANAEVALQSYRSNLRILGVAAIVMGALWLVGGGVMALTGTLGSLGVLDPSDTLVERIGGGIVAAVIATIGLLGGLLNIVTGVALWRVQPWARTLGFVAAGVNVLGGCCSFLSIGLTIWLLVVLLDARATAAFRNSVAER